ncbi:MAG: hypothetical protein N4A44_03080 [Alphaproteobacteria bacterium]|jgi:hypothetical protein|nr:hypothetical protein [Alphaproteobacteria bacterium]
METNINIKGLIIEISFTYEDGKKVSYYSLYLIRKTFSNLIKYLVYVDEKDQVFFKIYYDVGIDDYILTEYFESGLKVNGSYVSEEEFNENIESKRFRPEETAAFKELIKKLKSKEAIPETNEKI